MEQDNKGEPDQEPTTIALTIAVPEKVGWSVRAGDNTWSGDDIKGLVQHIGETKIEWPATLSISLLFELTGDVEAVRSRPNHPTKGRGI
ncbi:hypothetical protein ACFFUT_08585 [Pseudohalocynthiibacter aestuariivivens]|uniref:Uncharacterized protein n=1 Tax=Pseudohalocynthiibacter aestuariivivens TaxID=1591409 RepID=A0ABV5JEG5_9RHOB|nr:hypothetical protein [Pseudohalocynthiibacter aestuariivivens]MBS9717037.1 hypothetical protein [Pseudohalocynthiibacter aestuariivivens]